MGQTLAQLRDEIYADFPQIRANTDYPVARIVRYLNEAQWFVQTELNGLGMKKWEYSAALALSADGSYAALSLKKGAVPTDMLESPSSIILISCTGVSKSGIASGPGVDPRIAAKNWNNSFMAPTESDPAFFRLSGYIYLAPSTLTAATIHYLQALTAMAADADVCGIPVEFQKFVIQHAEASVKTALDKSADMKQMETEIANGLTEQYNKLLSREATAQNETKQSIQLQ